jgi:uncharacterized protein with HEPN domain
MADKNMQAVWKIRREAGLIAEFIKDVNYEQFASDEMRKRAVTQTLANIGELERVLDDGFKAERSCVPWAAIRKTRNVIAHDYMSVNFQTIWQTAVESIPELLRMLEQADNSETQKTRE